MHTYVKSRSVRSNIYRWNGEKKSDCSKWTTTALGQRKQFLAGLSTWINSRETRIRMETRARTAWLSAGIWWGRVARHISFGGGEPLGWPSCSRNSAPSCANAIDCVDPWLNRSKKISALKNYGTNTILNWHYNQKFHVKSAITGNWIFRALYSQSLPSVNSRETTDWINTKTFPMLFSSPARWTQQHFIFKLYLTKKASYSLKNFLYFTENTMLFQYNVFELILNNYSLSAQKLMFSKR